LPVEVFAVALRFSFPIFLSSKVKFSALPSNSIKGLPKGFCKVSEPVKIPSNLGNSFIKGVKSVMFTFFNSATISALPVTSFSFVPIIID